MRFWSRVRRLREATDEQLVNTGAWNGYGYGGVDPIDGDRGYQPLGGGGLRQVPWWTLEKARAASVAGYRANPMARGVTDTFTSFAVGDSGLTPQSSNDDVRVVVEEFWNDPANCLADQDIFLRGHLLNGESVVEMMTGPVSGVVRRSVIDPARVADVELYRGNPLWPGVLHFHATGGDPIEQLTVVRVDDFTGLRDGDAMFWRSFRALETDRRGAPFLMPILDWIDNYDQVLSNLIDRTALARYLAYDVTLKGNGPDGQPWTQQQINDWVQGRGGPGMPRSGTIEAHNESVEWKAMNAQSGSFEDTATAGTILTSVAAGAGLSKHWLAEPDQANRATSQSMAEPVRRRVGGVQNLWLSYQTELVRFAVDRAVAAGRLPSMVPIAAPGAGDPEQMVPASSTVTVTGPEVAAADAQVISTVMWNVAQSLEKFVAVGALSPEASRIAAQKAWEQFTGLPFPANLAADDTDATANEVNDAGGPAAGSAALALAAS